MKRVIIGLMALVALWLGLAACGEDKTATPTPVPASATALPAPAQAPVPPASPASLATASPAATTADPVNYAALPGVAGEIPAPPQGRKLNLPPDILPKVQNRLGGRAAQAELSGLQSAAYSAPDLPVDLFDFYRKALAAKGWSASPAYDNRLGIYFVKGGQVTGIGVIGVPDEATVSFLAGFVPELKGQIKGGESLVLLAQGPAAVFEAAKKPQE